MWLDNFLLVPKRLDSWISLAISAESELEKVLHGKDIWRTLWSNGVNPHDIHWRIIAFLKKVISAKSYQLALTEKEAGQKESCQTPKILEAGNGLITLLRCTHVQPFRKKEMQVHHCGLDPRGQSHACRC